MENVAVDHLSHLKKGNDFEEPKEIEKLFPDEQMLMVDASLPWYVDIVNFLACKVLPP